MLLLRLAMVLATGVPSVCTPLSICQVTDRAGHEHEAAAKAEVGRAHVEPEPAGLVDRCRRPCHRLAPVLPWMTDPGSVAPVVWPSSSHGTIVP